MPRPIVLTQLDTGITRLKEKGGASPGSLYDLLNGYVDQSGTPVGRDGTTLDYTLPAGTTGLCAFGGKLHVFSTVPVTVTDPLYVVDVLVYPVAGTSATIAKIHFAKPFLGYLYVVAEFSTGLVQHYWLQEPKTWAPNTIYGLTDIVQPSSPNGFYYQASTPVTAPIWQQNTVYPVGSIVQPSTPNGFVYQITSTAGTAAASGSTEPAWPTQAGAVVFEEVDSTTVPSTGQTQTTSTSTVLPATIAGRYGNSQQVNNA